MLSDTSPMTFESGISAPVLRKRRANWHSLGFQQRALASRRPARPNGWTVLSASRVGAPRSLVARTGTPRPELTTAAGQGLGHGAREPTLLVFRVQCFLGS